MNIQKSLLILLMATLGLFVGSEALAARTTTYYHTDGLGSVVAATNDSGQVLWRKDYAPFGEQIDTTPETERTAYTGKQHDDVTGLTYFGARYFDPEIGRFMSVDPVGFVEDNPMSFNRYLYVNNNPYKYVDPDGEFLNFVAKFVFDVGINVAFNYVTTGELNVGGALKESAIGVFNPAKTAAKTGELVMFAAKARKSQKAASSVASGAARDARRVAEQRARRAVRRERESREGPDGARDQAGNPQKPSGEGKYRDHENANRGPAGERPAGPDRSSNRERNIGIDEEHSRRPKGGFRDR